MCSSSNFAKVSNNFKVKYLVTIGENLPFHDLSVRWVVEVSPKFRDLSDIPIFQINLLCLKACLLVYLYVVKIFKWGGKALVGVYNKQ